MVRLIVNHKIHHLVCHLGSLVASLFFDLFSRIPSQHINWTQHITIYHFISRSLFSFSKRLLLQLLQCCYLSFPWNAIDSSDICVQFCILSSVCPFFCVCFRWRWCFVVNLVTISCCNIPAEKPFILWIWVKSPYQRMHWCTWKVCTHTQSDIDSVISSDQ